MIRFLCTTLSFLCFAMAANAQTIAVGLSAEVPQEPSGRLEHILRRGTLIVGVKADYPPWGLIGSDGQLEGLEIDLAQDFANRLGVDLELKAVTSSNRIGRVNGRIVDVVIATAGDTEERRLQADHILPNYYSSGVVVYARADRGIDSWDKVRGRDLCLNRGSYYNRTLEGEFGIKGQYFAGTRESRLALLQGRCVGWAFDDTALAQFINESAARAETEGEAATQYAILDDAILVTPWSLIVEKGEGQGDLGRFASDLIAEWHATGRIIALQRKWNIPVSNYILEKNAQWSETDAAGNAICGRSPDSGAFSKECLGSDPFKRPPSPVLPDWMKSLNDRIGIDLSALVNEYARDSLIKGLWLTLALGLAAIFGALVVGFSFAMMHALLCRRGIIGWILLLPQKVLITVARMTPPILQLYIVYFGLGGTLTERFNLTPSNFLIAAVILSLYAGATNAVILVNAVSQELRVSPKSQPLQLLPGVIKRAFDGVVASCVNIVKAAGMASAIAVTEVISTINLLVAEGANKATFMNGLLVFYFFLVLAIIWIFKLVRRALVGQT